MDSVRHGAQLSILTHARSERRCAELIARCDLGSRAEVYLAPDDLAFSIWAQDAILAARTAAGRGRLLRPARFDRYDDARAAQLLAEGIGLPVQTVPFTVDGGDLLVGQAVALVGADSLTRSAAVMRDQGHEMDQAGIAQRLQALLPRQDLVPVRCESTVPAQRERELHLAGQSWRERLNFNSEPETRQPLFHIDLFLALAGPSASGRERVLVGDPGLAARLLGHPERPHALAGHFDEVAEGLAAQGLEVYRNPLPLIWMDEPGKRLRTWFFAPSINVWVARDPAGGNHVWLPCFSATTWFELEAVDDANAALWTSLGYSVHRVAGFLPMAENLGGLNCMGKILERDDVTAQ